MAMSNWAGDHWARINSATIVSPPWIFLTGVPFSPVPYSSVFTGTCSCPMRTMDPSAVRPSSVSDPAAPQKIRCAPTLTSEVWMPALMPPLLSGHLVRPLEPRLLVADLPRVGRHALDLVHDDRPPEVAVLLVLPRVGEIRADDRHVPCRGRRQAVAQAPGVEQGLRVALPSHLDRDRRERRPDADRPVLPAPQGEVAVRRPQQVQADAPHGRGQGLRATG